MKPCIAIIAPGQMGAAIGRRLSGHGVEVRTMLHGRSHASRERASAAGMKEVDVAGIASCDFVLSILPPGDAAGLADVLLPHLAKAGARALYVDCNAVSPQTVKGIAAKSETFGIAFVDAGIIGGPPRGDTEGPSIYASGVEAQRLASLGAYGLTIKVLDAPIGAASALKMAYAGITKGLTGLATAMLLGASREGAAAALHAELGESQSGLLARFGKSIPEMYPKAYRWVAEMEQIAEFLKDDPAAAAMFQGLARLYERIAIDHSRGRKETGMLDAFLAKES